MSDFLRIGAFLRWLFLPKHWIRTCVGCGCTDDRACVNILTGERCCWVAGYDGDLCSFCARTMSASKAGTPPSGRAA